MADDMKRFRIQVIADNSGEWCGNGRTFETEAEAWEAADNLASRWTLVKEWRVLERKAGVPAPQNVSAPLGEGEEWVTKEKKW